MKQKEDPDGFASYCHDLRNEDPLFFHNLQDGGSVMDSEVFEPLGEIPIVFIGTWFIAARYQYVLSFALLPYTNETVNLKFQQDNAPIYRACFFIILSHTIKIQRVTI